MVNSFALRLISLYRTYLGKYFIFRLVRVATSYSYIAIYRIYCSLTFFGTVTDYSLINYGSYSGSHLVLRLPIFPSQLHSIKPPKIVNHHSEFSSVNLSKPKGMIWKIDLIELRNILVVGGSDFIFAGKMAIVPDCFIEFKDTCPSNIFGVTTINHLRRSLRLYLSEKNLSVKSAISLLGQSSANYAHWLTEILPKLAMLEFYPQYSHLPILVDAHLHPNIYESIAVVAGKHRILIFVERWVGVEIENAICITQPGYEPYIPHGLFNTGIPRLSNLFSTHALITLRNTVLNSSVYSKKGKRIKIFFCRNSSSRNFRTLKNSAQIEDLLKKNDFLIVDPFELTFIEQVQLCHAASIIVAPVGASLANMIFASSDCYILGLSPYYKNANYYFYSNLAAALNINFAYILGYQVGKGGHPSQRSYEINIADLMSALGLSLENSKSQF